MRFGLSFVDQQDFKRYRDFEKLFENYGVLVMSGRLLGEAQGGRAGRL
jgi:hypothetical protein